jgi:hypothetical protein
VTDLVEHARLATLVVVSIRMLVGDLSSFLGVEPDRSRGIGGVGTNSPVRIPARETSWEMFEHSDSSEDISALVEQLFLRVLPLRQALIALSSADCVIKLNIVQWITALDAVGPGISLEASRRRVPGSDKSVYRRGPVCRI